MSKPVPLHIVEKAKKQMDVADRILDGIVVFFKWAGIALGIGAFLFLVWLVYETSIIAGIVVTAILAIGGLFFGSLFVYNRAFDIVEKSEKNGVIDE